jgi:hypothetical protein
MSRRATGLPAHRIAVLCGATIVGVRDLERLGLHRATIAKRCRPGGPWQSLAPGIIVLHNGPRSRDDKRRGALVHAGPQSIITGLDALELHGMDRVPAPSGPVHVLVPGDRRRVGYGLALVERTDRLPEPAPGRWPLAPLPRAVLDYVRRIRDRDLVRSALAEVVQRGRATPAQLVRELDDGAQRGTRLPREVLREVGDGVRSVAEARARTLLRRSRTLPAAMWNPRIVDASGRFIASPDAWFDDVAMAWELDSREWHMSPADYDLTLERRSAMIAAGIVVIATQPSRTYKAAPAVLEELEAAHAQAALRPRPQLHAIPATNGTSVG